MLNALKVAHRWVALAVSVILVFTATSGALLVFEGAIDRALNQGLWRVEPSASTLPIDTLVAHVEARFSPSTVGSVGLSPAPDRAWTMNAGPLAVFVNPYTGEITGTRTPEQSQKSLARRLHVFHVELFAGKIGRSVVGVVTIAAFFLAITGIILWWPDKIFRIKTSASWKRINFDLHHALGIAAAAILIVITASGLLIHYDALARTMKSLDSAPTAPPPAQPAGPASAPRLSFDAIADTARRALPGATVLFISIGGPKNPVTVAMRFPEDRTPGGRSRLFIDRYTGKVLGAVSTRDAQLGTRLDNLKRSLHTGDALGKPTEAIWLLAVLVMVSQIITGVLMWWNARASRRKVQAR